MDQPNFKRQFSSTSSSSSVWEPFQEERIKARAVDEETQMALANVGLKARMNVDRGYFTPVSSETRSTLGSKPIFRTTTFINSQVERSASLWSRTQSAPNQFQELQPFAISNSNSGLDPMEEEWIQSRRKGNGSVDSAASSQSGEIMVMDEEGENRPIGASNPSMQIKRGRDFGEADRDAIFARFAEEDDSAVPNLSTSSSTLESTSFPPETSSTPMTLQRTISALPSRSMNASSSCFSKDGSVPAELGRRPLARPTQSMPTSRGFFNDPYSGLGSMSNSNSDLGEYLNEASLAKTNRKFDFNANANADQRARKMEVAEDGEDAQMEDLQQYIQKQEGF